MHFPPQQKAHVMNSAMRPAMRPATHTSSRRSLLIGAATTSLLLLSLTACGGDSEAAGSAAARYELVQNGVITAGTQAEQPPSRSPTRPANPADSPST
ncbi:hypothetical protein [Streptomyces afghaniensis]|uniref:hypothetical protein n=1 Tax=Streptomyces afghaniensis TaxID=66865 RepID=UPI00277E3145|nr:hypothetical protein [Streptomyces afghaniensis]MDQ1017618.1 hypothetical protein [Streptomyces afghaniensis]